MKKSNLYGLIGSVLSCVLLFLILWFVLMPLTVNKPTEDEGLIVSFGNNNDGSGMQEMSVAKTENTVKHNIASGKSDLMTQKDNSLAIVEQKQKKKQQEQIDRQRLDNEKKLAEEKRNEQEAIDKANVMNGMFGNNNSRGKGTGSGESQQGNPVGKGSSGGNSWSLNGRILTGHLVSPSYNRDVEGKITVNIMVDVNGNVTSSSIGSPTTISDFETRNAAIKAANNTHFSSGKNISSGTITYNFKLK
ncbi:MAG: energy transducer TonB [Paludibacter sp.]